MFVCLFVGIVLILKTTINLKYNFRIVSVGENHE